MADVVAAQQVIRRIVRLEVGRDGPPDALAEQRLVAVDKAVGLTLLPQLQDHIRDHIHAEMGSPCDLHMPADLLRLQIFFFQTFQRRLDRLRTFEHRFSLRRQRHAALATI